MVYNKRMGMNYVHIYVRIYIKTVVMLTRNTTKLEVSVS